MSKDSSAKYYQNNKERLQKISRESLPKKLTIWSINNPKIYRKMKNKSLWNVEENVIKSEKLPYYSCKKLFSFRKSIIILKSNDGTINLL